MSLSSLCLPQLLWKEPFRWTWQACSDTSLGPRGSWDSTEAWHPTSWKSFHQSASATWSMSTLRSRWESSQDEEGGAERGDQDAKGFHAFLFWAEIDCVLALRNKQLTLSITKSNNQIPGFKGRDMMWVRGWWDAGKPDWRNVCNLVLFRSLFWQIQQCFNTC